MCVCAFEDGVKCRVASVYTPTNSGVTVQLRISAKRGFVFIDFLGTAGPKSLDIYLL